MPHTDHSLSTTGDELNKRMDVMVDLRKATNHPLLLRHHCTDHTLHCMVKAILKEPSHRDAVPNLVWEDMSVMSDFELHNLCTLYKVCGCVCGCVWVWVWVWVWVGVCVCVCVGVGVWVWVFIV